MFGLVHSWVHALELTPSSVIHRGNPNTRGSFLSRECKCESVQGCPQWWQVKEFYWKVCENYLAWALFPHKTNRWPARPLDRQTDSGRMNRHTSFHSSVCYSYRLKQEEEEKVTHNGLLKYAFIYVWMIQTGRIIVRHELLNWSIKKTDIAYRYTREWWLLLRLQVYMISIAYNSTTQWVSMTGLQKNEYYSQYHPNYAKDLEATKVSKKQTLVWKV